jgi:hypothetical protein
MGVAFADVPPASLKKFACGKGNAKKEEMLAAAIRRLGYEGSSFDEVDALWLRAMGCEALATPLVKMPAAHLDALKAVDWPVVA